MKDQRIADWSSLGAIVRHARKDHAWSQQALSERAGVSRAWLAKFESGHRTAELEQILKTLKALDIDLVARAAIRNEKDESLKAALAKKRDSRLARRDHA